MAYVNDEAANAPGRPLSSSATAKVLAAALSLLETGGMGTLSINAVAKASGVSRPAIYRRWSHPIAIALDAVLEVAEREIPSEASGDAIAALRAHIMGLVHFLRGSRGRIMTELLGLAQSDTALVALIRDQFLDKRRTEGRKLLARVAEAGVIDHDANFELLIDLYAGPAYFRALTRPDELTEAFVDDLLRAVISVGHTA